LWARLTEDALPKSSRNCQNESCLMEPSGRHVSRDAALFSDATRYGPMLASSARRGRSRVPMVGRMDTRPRIMRL